MPRQNNNSSAAARASGPTHRTAEQPKGVLRTTTTTSPASGQTTDPRLAANEFEAAIGLVQLQRAIDKHESRERKLAQLAAEDQIGHYYAQTPAERAPGALAGAAVLFGMAGGDAAQPAALLTLLRLHRKRAEGAKRAGSARLVGRWRVSLSCRISRLQTNPNA